jgi:hypothetical protein
VDRVVAHQPPGQAGQEQGKQAHDDKHVTPADIAQRPGKRRCSQHGAEIAEQDGKAGQGAEMAFVEPGGVEFQQRNEGDGNTQADQQAADRGQAEAVGQAKQQ